MQKSVFHWTDLFKTKYKINAGQIRKVSFMFDKNIFCSMVNNFSFKNKIFVRPSISCFSTQFHLQRRFVISPGGFRYIYMETRRWRTFFKSEKFLLRHPLINIKTYVLLSFFWRTGKMCNVCYFHTMKKYFSFIVSKLKISLG